MVDQRLIDVLMINGNNFTINHFIKTIIFNLSSLVRAELT